MAGFTKLFSDIVDSSIWDESPEICKVWVTLLAMSDSDGFVRGSEGWLAAKSKVSIGKVVLALNRFQQPDLASRTPDNEGRRIKVVPHGWLILNYNIFRDRLTAKDPHRTTYQREWMRKKRSLEASEPCQHLSTLSTCVNDDNTASASVSASGSSSASNSCFPELEKRLLIMFKREVNGMVYDEQQPIFHLSSRPKVLLELKELETFKSRPESYFPQSLASLVANWQQTLDRARSWQPKRTPEEQRRIKNLVDSI